MVLLLVHPRPRTSSNTVTVITSQIHAYQDGSPGLTIHCQTCIRDENYIRFYYTCYILCCMFVFMKNIPLHAIKEHTPLFKSNSHLYMYMVNVKERYIEFFHEF